MVEDDDTQDGLEESAMTAREVLAQTGEDYSFDVDEVPIEDEEVLSLLEPSVQEWWARQFGSYVPQNTGFFTPPQRGAIPLIHNKENTLIVAPTGSGKTNASFTAIINELYRLQRTAGGLENSVYCLYISPLKSLANDIKRNLEEPLEGIKERFDERGEDVDHVRQAIRHGDTDSAARQRMLKQTPHILNTTPETLAILLNSPKFCEKLATVEYVIIDEIHSLADNKRGTHLSVSLERLENLCEESPTRIGCSATVEPLDTIADFLVGCDDNGETRPYEIVDTRFVRDFDIEVQCPTDDLINTPPDQLSDRFYQRLDDLITAHENTLIFTNTRSGAERILFNLRERYPDTYDEENSGCHHGSLSKDKRQEVEQGLKKGEFDFVTTSTSLELGIDMPYIDLVVQVGSPKSVASMLQRVGRAGHRVGETVTGRIVVLDRDELVECAVMAYQAAKGFVDRVFIPEKPQDVATQHVYGMAIAEVRPEAEILATLRRAYPYRNYTDDDWEQLMRYMTAEYEGMEDKNVYAKIWRDTNDEPDGEHHYEEYEPGTPLIGKRGRLAQVIYMTNIGTIPDSFTCDVYTRGDKSWVGSLDEEYLNTLEKGDVFALAGGKYEYRYRRGSKVYVDPTSAQPTVPSWFSERLPLSYDLALQILDFQQTITSRMMMRGGEATLEWLLAEFNVDENTANALLSIYEEQVLFTGFEGVATKTNMPIEEYVDPEQEKRYYFVHSLYGRTFNDGFSRLVGHRLAQEVNGNVRVAVSDHGFTLTLSMAREADVARIIRSITPEEVEGHLRASLNGTDLLKRYFRINATRSLMILKNYKGREKSAAQQQVSSEMLLGFADDLDEFAVIEETYREILEDKLAIEAIQDILQAVAANEIDVVQQTVGTPSPRAFGLATLAASDTVLADDQSRVLREFHERVQQAIGRD